ncbi:MAG TPA: RNA 2',3'-cyclic phosphodiesterase [Candidatus Limnocylindria bacterium]|nr:RNA 2',3'-cyclic phosphodiesterase [Candidatus Limnocylindria bacterium]
MSDERWRCFVAVPIGDRLRTDLASAVATWRSDPAFAELRWTDPDAWHVTLAFLGWTDPSSVAPVVASVRAVAAGAFAATLPTGGLGAFPSPGRARVLWYAIEDANGLLTGLSVSLHRALGLEGTDRFRPHLTLARARREPVRLRDAISRLVAPPGTLAVEEIRLMRSHLGGNRPARYETLESVHIGTSVRA